MPSASVDSPAMVKPGLLRISVKAYRTSCHSVCMSEDYTWFMARRGFTILFTLLGAAVFLSILGFALLYVAFGREPAVPSNATLELRVGGALAETAPNDVVGYLRGTKTPTVRGIVDNLRKAKV